MRSASFRSTVARWPGALFAQEPDSNAARPAATARSTSSASPNATWAISCPVEGSMLENVRPDAEATSSPPMKWDTVPVRSTTVIAVSS
jgi:hypothetical protein